MSRPPESDSATVTLRKSGRDRRAVLRVPMRTKTVDGTGAWLPEGHDNQQALRLVVVHHPSSERIGAARVLEEGVPFELRRGGPEFGPCVLDDERLSGRHARVVSEGGGVTLVDLGSRNGTWVGRRRIQQAQLQVGDVFAAGQLLFVVANALPAGPLPTTGQVQGVSAGIAEVLLQLDQAAKHSTTTLLLGDTGVGKELLAAEVHARSGRDGAFVAVNCGALPKDLLQSELFGHARGAFSGASGRRRGLVEEAEGGTLFLDEIGEAPPELQVALLRLLELREIRPVGSNATRQVDVRFVAATHRDLHALVAEGRFREDLLRRLYRWVVTVPPLRDRRADISVIAHHLLTVSSRPRLRLAGPLMWTLLEHDWPGNVRELVAVVERLVVGHTGGRTIKTPPWLNSMLRPAVAESTVPGSPVKASVVPAEASDRRSSRPARPSAHRLQELLEANGGNVQTLARTLKVSRNTLYRWFKEGGIDPRKSRG